MKRNILNALLMIGIFTVCGAAAAHAQTDIVGKYKFEAKNFDDNPDNYESLFEIIIELKAEKTAVFTKTKSEVTEIEKKGSWTWNNSGKLITVVFPAVFNSKGKKEYEKVTLTFRPDGANLKLTGVLPASAGKTGDVFTKTEVE